MNSKKDMNIEQQLKELQDKANKQYPEIAEALLTYNSATAENDIYNEYINSITDIPIAYTTNQAK
jgi:hypothetical protein